MTIPFSGFKGTTLVDYPGKVASIIFVSGCNLRCPYCHNGRLFQVDKKSLISPVFLMEKLRERKEFIEAAVFSGGEPSLYEELAGFIEEVKESLGLNIKLDTNGLNPPFIEKVSKYVDYFAIDIKATPMLYSTLLGADMSSDEVRSNLMATKQFLETQSGKIVEYRTTLYPPVVSLPFLQEMSAFVPRNASWYLQQFVAATAWSKEAQQTPPYTNSQINSLANSLKDLGYHALVRN